MDQEKWDRNLVNQVPVHFLRCETGSFADAHNEKQPLAIATYIFKNWYVAQQTGQIASCFLLGRPIQSFHLLA